MSFRQNVWNSIRELNRSINNLRSDMCNAMCRRKLEICDLRKDIGSLQERITRLGQEWDKTTIKTNGLKTQITDLKQEICGLKIGHKFEYAGDIGSFIFVCKLCDYVELKNENELTPTEKKALQSLGILNELAKKRGD